jgi:phospholipid/cholesterol/gamma-HCH transport system ATP-binding protein
MPDSKTNSYLLETRRLYKSFNSQIVLNGVDLHLKKGENLVVLGKSGSGKSVLIKCIIGLMGADTGEIFVFGREISSLSYPELNKTRIKIGFLFQNAALYDSMTVHENLAFPLKNHFKNLSVSDREETIIRELENLGLHSAIDKMPSELSGGMSKRIALARALILKPEIMLYDEPTTGLDSVNSKEISMLIMEMQKKNNISSVIITHDMACAKITADRIVMLKDGVIAAQGSYKELEDSKDEWIKSFFC